jgi:phosphohistidine phosphatase
VERGSPPQVVVLVRHGDALTEEQDPRRPLSDTGREHVQKVSDLVVNLALEIEEVRHSGKERARQTAEIFAARIGVGSDRVREAKGLKPKDDVRPVAEELEREGSSVALVGHLPFLASLASRLLSGDEDRVRCHFGDGGCLVVVREDKGWRLEDLVNHDLFP